MMKYHVCLKVLYCCNLKASFKGFVLQDELGCEVLRFGHNELSK